MTGIVPQSHIPLSPWSGSHFVGPDSSNPAETPFDSFLAPPTAGTPGADQGPAGMERLPSLSRDVAHLFNEFGFFAAQTEPPHAQDDASIETWHGGNAPSAAAGVGSRFGQASAQSSGVAPSPATPDTSAEAGSADAVAKGVSEVDHQPRAVGAGGNLGTFRRFPITPTSLPRSPSDGIASDWIEGDGSLGRYTPDPESAGPRTEAREAGQSSDRLLFQIGGHQVELIGRLAKLGDEEERRLVEALGELLEAHGMSLATATLNGRPAVFRLGRGEG